MKRSYRVHVPDGYSPEKPAPLVLVLHGGWGTGKIIQWQSRMTGVSERHDFIAVFPDGYRRSWNAGKCCGPAMKNNSNVCCLN